MFMATTPKKTEDRSEAETGRLAEAALKRALETPPTPHKPKALKKGGKPKPK
jgi:hypothetical protein